MKRNLKNILGVIMAATIAMTTVCAPTALNDSRTMAKNTIADIAVLTNDISAPLALDPSSLTILVGPSNGQITAVSVTGVVTYKPFTGFAGSDFFTYRIFDTEGGSSDATVYITVFDPDKPCPTVCPTACCGCFDMVDECLCTEASFDNFTQVSGSWVQSGNHVSTDPGSNNFSFLQYNTPVDQTFEDLQVKLFFPSTQTVLSQFISAGLVTNWDGATVPPTFGQKVAYISFDNRFGAPQTSKLAVGGLNSTETIFLLPFQIQYDTYYTLHLIKNNLQVYAFIDDIFIGTSSNGLVTGSFIGVWSFQATVQFNDLKSCSYRNPLKVPDFQPVEAADPLLFPVFPPA